jgi:hypothetical protein
MSVIPVRYTRTVENTVNHVKRCVHHCSEIAVVVLYGYCTCKGTAGCGGVTIWRTSLHVACYLRLHVDNIEEQMGTCLIPLKCDDEKEGLERAG